MNNCVGFEIGNHALHIAQLKGGVVVRADSRRLESDLVKNGVITSYDAMADRLKSVRKDGGYPSCSAALILPSSLCYCRRFFVAAKTREQLMFNLPYGFADFITDDKSHYFFDCAILGAVKGEENCPPDFDVFATAARKDVIEAYSGMFAKAGFRLKTVIPAEFAYMNLLRRSGADHHHGILDIGHSAVRLYLYDGHLFEGVRVIDYGMSAVDEIIAEEMGVNLHMAASYRESGFGGAGESEACRAVYGAMALEVLKATNFYRFNGGISLGHLHCCGGGTHSSALMETLRSTLSVPLTDMSELVSPIAGADVDLSEAAVAAGVAIQ